MVVVRRSFLLLASLGFILSLSFGCRSPWSLQQGQINRPPPLPQHPQIEAYFNQNPAEEYRDPYRDISRNGDNLEQLLIDNIENAQERIDIAVQELRLPKLAQAIARQHQAGIAIRIILEHDYNRPWSDYRPEEIRQFDDRQRARYEEAKRLIDRNNDGVMSAEEIAENDALVILRDAQLPTRDDTADGSQGSGLMHHKFVLIDNTILVTGSANFTLSGVHGDMGETASRGNPNHLLRIESPELVSVFREEFNFMWGGGEDNSPQSRFGLQKPNRPLRSFMVNDTLVSVKFSPTSTTLPWQESTNGAIATAIDSAQDTIDLALFVFSSQPIANKLLERHQIGVEVRALIDRGFAFRYYSEGLDLLGVALADSQCRYEVDNQPWSSPISTVGVPQLPPGDILHHKFGLLDDSLVITGSHNWSKAANTTNDETLLLIQNETVAAHFRREFDRLYTTATVGLPPWIVQQIEEREAECSAITERSSDIPDVVNLNTATLEELRTLPRVGEVLAQRIVEARPFSSLDDVRRVSGIGEKTIEGWGDRARISDD
ncbi:MAG: phospholipase D-like domain-containing protein [Phormidium sp.]